MTLSWDDPGDSSITGYRILRRDVANQDPGDFSTVESNTGSSATTYTDNQVSAHKRYAYRVKAINSEGPGGQSNYVNVEPPAAPVSAGLSEASLRINGSPNFDTVLMKLRDHCSLFGVGTPELTRGDLLS